MIEKVTHIKFDVLIENTERDLLISLYCTHI
jgi:hypothetical protein